MIISNGLLFFFSHIFEFIVTVLLLVYRKQLGDFCYYLFRCNEYIDLSQTFNYISISLQFFVFKRFDKNFATILNSIASKIISKITFQIFQRS